MRLEIIAFHHKVPAWIETGLQEFLKRFPKTFSVELIDLKPAQRTENTPRSHILELEQQKIEDFLSRNKSFTNQSSKNTLFIVLDERGSEWTTKELSQKLESWQNQSHHLTFLIGGAEGISNDLKKRADFVWSLSKLTLPHLFAKLLVVEQLYRAISLLQNHPYHRE